MKTIYIRFKSLFVLGLVFLGISFVWFAVTTYHQAQQIVHTEETNPVINPVIIPESKITIVPQENKELTDDFFAEYRLERERMRSEQVEILNEIINNPNSHAEAKSEAQKKLLWFTNNLGKETKIEKALLAKGFIDAAVAIEAETIMVIVPSEGLRQDEVSKIADIVVKVAECQFEDVIIVPKGI